MLPTPRPRSHLWALGLAAVAASTCLSGCGASDSDRIKDAVRNYIQAVLDDNGRLACDLLTPDAARAFVEKVRSTTKTSDCATAFKQEAATLKDDDKAIYRSAVLAGVDVTGDTATVTVRFTGVDKKIQLKKVKGDWRIDTGPSG
ncbi:MAG: hypothetical protein QOG45_1534 [Chloroflexota bacterium]|jgi:hypothetical protein|nr:hypothetical protein [Chloroflexota bacterium]